MTLKIGSEGEDVKKLQTVLGLKADGKFGPGTQAALKSWQEKNGLDADGIAGQKTLEKMGTISLQAQLGLIPQSCYK